MRFFKNVVLPVAVVVGLIAGLTYVSHYAGSPGKQAVPTRPRPVDDGPEFTREARPWASEEFELRTPGHCDFWLHNPRAEPVSIRLVSLSCACASVSLGQLEPADMCDIQARAAGLVAWPGPLAAEAWRQELEFRLRRWRPLEVINGQPVTLPARVVRLSWAGKKLGPEDLTARLELNGQPRPLEVPLWFVPPVQVWPKTAMVKELGTPGQKETVECDVWSSTRATFELSLAVPKPHPCLEVAWKPLTEEQRRTLEADRRTRVRHGFRVTVTVHERRGDKELLDLGLYRRTVVLAASGTDEPVELALAGVVRGELTVVSPDDRDLIDLKNFPRDRGTSKQVILEAPEGGPELRLVPGPEDIEVKLEPRPPVEGRRRWELQVRVPPGRPSGPLPADCAVVIELRGETTRQARIPVIGAATQR